MRLLPKSVEFYKQILCQAELISEASCLLVAGAKTGNNELAGAAAAIQRLENTGDQIVHDISLRLNQTFITPIDPEDIHELSSRLDDVLDGIEDAVHRMSAYRLEPIPKQVIELCEIVAECSKTLLVAVQVSRDKKPPLEYCAEINRLERRADQLVRSAVAELFKKEIQAIELIKVKEVYEVLEATTDRCQDVADVLQSIMVKNS